MPLSLSMTALYGKILLIDNDLTFLNKIQGELKLLESFPLIIKKNISEAHKTFLKEKGLIRGVFISSKLFDERSSSIVESMAGTDKELPFILICHDPDKVNMHSEKSNAFSSRVERPDSYLDLLKDLKKFVGDKKWVSINPTDDQKDIEIEKQETDFLSTPLKDYVFTEKSLFNLYIKIGTKRFVKIVNSGDPVTDETLEIFNKKGISEIHIPAGEYDRYVRLSQELSTSTLRSNKPATKKVENLLLFGTSIANSLVQKGISPKKLDTSNELLNQSVSLVKNLRMRDQSLTRFIELIEVKEHLSFVSFLSCLIANEVGFESSKMVKLVGLSGLLHDIGLYTLDPKIEDESKAISESPEAFRDHAIFGANLLRKSGNIDEAVCLAIEQHHMRRKGLKDNKNTNINLLTEVIGAADLVHNYVINDGFSKDKLQFMLEEDLKSFSTPIEKSVAKLFRK